MKKVIMEILETFNENNEKVGEATGSEAHKKGLYHRYVSVFLINSEGVLSYPFECNGYKISPEKRELGFKYSNI